MEWFAVALLVVVWMYESEIREFIKAKTESLKSSKEKDEG